jgi:hypothetical protein
MWGLVLSGNGVAVSAATTVGVTSLSTVSPAGLGVVRLQAAPWERLSLATNIC